MTRLDRRISAWVAILAMTLNALWPVIAQAKPGPSPTLQEVCTSAGLQKIVVDGAQPAGHSSDGKASPHCAFCSLGTDQLAILPAVQVGIAQVLEVRDSLPVHSEAPLQEPSVLLPAQPRAPPSLS
jgi:hypothetical protein